MPGTGLGIEDVKSNDIVAILPLDSLGSMQMGESIPHTISPKTGDTESHGGPDQGCPDLQVAENVHNWDSDTEFRRKNQVSQIRGSESFSSGAEPVGIREERSLRSWRNGWMGEMAGGEAWV